MATPSTTAFSLTNDPIIDAATHGYTWQLDGSRTIRWSISDGFAGEYWINPTALIAGIDQIFDTFSYYGNVDFVYGGYFQTPSDAGAYSDVNVTLDGAYRYFSSYTTWGRAFFPESANNYYYSGAPGDVYLNINSAANYLSSYALGSAGYFLFLHEIGHALGLKHPHDNGGTNRPTLSSLGISFLDQDWFSIMSYNDEYGWDRVNWDPASPMLLDVLAIQYLYGKNMQTNLGDTDYTLPLNNYYATVWDAGGNDTLALSSSTRAWTILLPELQLSTLVDTRAGVAYPSGDAYLASPHTLYWLTGDIENVDGSPYGDTIQGSSLNNYFRGNGGIDDIDGGNGIDTAMYHSNRIGTTITRTATGYRVATASTRDGTDTLSGIEYLSFADTSLNLTYNDSIQQLYVAYFGRPADSTGWTNFTASLAAAGAPTAIQELNAAYATNTAFRQLVDAFGTSAESGRLYTGDTASFVTAIFQNVLGRAPQATGLAYWQSTIDSGTLSRGNAALSIMAGALTNTSTQGQLDATLITNKIRIASNFTFALDTTSEVTAYRGSTAAATARSMLSAVSTSTNPDGYQSTVTVTIANIVAGRSAHAEEFLPEDAAVQLVGVAPLSEGFGIA